jgi:pimeloyl-ACP methyl ester carboxylesterase
MDVNTLLARSNDVNKKLWLGYQERTKKAFEHFTGRISEALKTDRPDSPIRTMTSSNPWDAGLYAVDALQRSILFWDTMRQRGNVYNEHSSSGQPPLLHFDYETVLDGRTFDRPVNYALLRIVPPNGVTVDAKKRPYMIIDPRAGHGPGIGGFKEDSQVGAALHAGHPVYFVVFFRDPEPGQTLLDVCELEQVFLKKVRALHPDSPKPAIIGNCQGGWAAMMLATTDPDDAGPVVVVGAPMSYWSGAWSDGQGDNPMRYAGGNLGGTWLSSLTADMGNGKFDGAHLVQNFENLNPANTLWNKYYDLYRNVDTETARFLEFERWWGGFFLMNREEIEWITRNLFIGNKLWSGEVKGPNGKPFDLREIKSPIILFASMGDNITPPQQAFNWVIDQYESTEEIKARGQTIVGLMHQDVGHLGIFVSGKVAKKEYRQIVSVLNQIDLLPPGLYAMSITERKGKDGQPEYDVDFTEHRLEDMVRDFNRYEREDEKPFEAVSVISDFNQRAYEMFAQPFVQAMSSEVSANLLRDFHPLRFQRWALSDLNPCVAWLAPAAEAVKSHRAKIDESHPLRHAEQAGSELISASLDCYRALRDATTEAMFFANYASMFGLHLADKQEQGKPATEPVTNPRDLPIVQAALSSISIGGYADAIARVTCLLTHNGVAMPLSELVKRKELMESYAEYLPALPAEQWRRIDGEQHIITLYEPEQAFRTLPDLVASPAERARLLALLDRLKADRRVHKLELDPQQEEMYDRIRAALAAVLNTKAEVASPRKRRIAAVA